SGPVGDRIFVGRVAVDGKERSISGRGNGLISGVVAALADTTGPVLDVVDYSEHAIGHGADAQAAAYVECRTADGGTVWGVGIDADVATASVRAVLSAANRAG
ncbi:MAG: 2-isopropylmalate synthase, partial [Sphingomonadales bacterium]|nr:2-isopropylmalate synthase [Sphingomonadales bacterium]